MPCRRCDSVFRAIWIASAISNLGALIQSVGAAWMMTSIADSADMVALVQASVTLPIMMLSLVAGAVADSVDRRKVMLVAQIFMCCVSVASSVCAWLGLITPWLLLMFTFLIGCGTAFNAPAWQASVGDMVPRPARRRRRVERHGVQCRSQLRPRDRRCDRRRRRRGRNVHDQCGQLHRTDHGARALATAGADASPASRIARHRDRVGRALRVDVAGDSH